MSSSIALSGLQATSQDLNTISNNIANSNTVGFRGARTEFAAVFNNGNPGGVNVMGTSQNFSKAGAMTYTGRQLDMGIQGKGFFALSGTDGSLKYSRSGMFHQDALGYIVDPTGNHLQGFKADSDGRLQLGNSGDLQVKTEPLKAKSTTKIDQVANLDSRMTAITKPFDPQDPSTYQSSGTVAIYDSLGNEHVMTQYYRKINDTTNEWQVYHAIDGKVVDNNYVKEKPASKDENGNPIAAIKGNPGTPTILLFNHDGTINTDEKQYPSKQNIDSGLAGPHINGSVILSNKGNGVADIIINCDYKNFTQFATDYNTSSLSQNGYTAGSFSKIQLDGDGRLYGIYTNGQKQLQGQVSLTDFNNANGLIPADNNTWVASAAAGSPKEGAPSSGTLGSVTGGYLENSNVDSTSEMVNLMSAQRNYQSNAKVLSVDSSMQQALMNAIG